MPDIFIPAEEKHIEQPVVAQPLTNLHSRNLPFFSAYCHYPTGLTFKDQNPDEQIVLFLRRHFITNNGWIITGFVLLLLPTVFLLLNTFLPGITINIPFRFLLVFGIFYYLLVIGYIFNSFIVWFYNVGIVTTEQIIDSDFSDIMYRSVAKARIHDVVDVEFKQGGILHSFFDFGDVFIQTEGVKPNFEFEKIPHPDTTGDIILELKGKAEHG